MGNCRAEMNEKTAFPGGTGDPWKVPFTPSSRPRRLLQAGQMQAGSPTSRRPVVAQGAAAP